MILLILSLSLCLLFNFLFVFHCGHCVHCVTQWHNNRFTLRVDEYIPFGTRAQTHHNASHGELRSRVLDVVGISAKINTHRIKCLVCYLFVGFYSPQTNEWTESNNSENENCCCCAVCAIRCMGNHSFFLHAFANVNILLETSLNVNNQYLLSIFHFLFLSLSVSYPISTQFLKNRLAIELLIESSEANMTQMTDGTQTQREREHSSSHVFVTNLLVSVGRWQNLLRITCVDAINTIE